MFLRRPKFIRRIKTDILLQNISAIILIIVLIIVYTYVRHSQVAIIQSESYIRSSTNFISAKITLSMNKMESVINSYVPLLESVDLKDYTNHAKLYKSFNFL